MGIYTKEQQKKIIEILSRDSTREIDYNGAGDEFIEKVNSFYWANVSEKRVNMAIKEIGIDFNQISEKSPDVVKNVVKKPNYLVKFFILILILIKKIFSYVKNHSTNFLLGIIIFILLFIFYDSSPKFQGWVIITKYRIIHPGYRNKTEVVGEAKYICRELDMKSYWDKLPDFHYDFEAAEKYRADNEKYFYKDVEKYTNVIRSRQWKFFIFKTSDKISFYPKMDSNCKCAETDPLTNKCKWTELEKPVPTVYLLETNR